MSPQEAMELIRPAVSEHPGGSWADLGAGGGLFTRALAELLGPGGRVYAIDHDPRAVAELRSLKTAADAAAVIPLEGDLRDLQCIEGLRDERLDGVLLANSLHFIAEAEDVLKQLLHRLRPGGRIVIVEYDGRPASRWVPHPVSLRRLRELASHTSLLPPRVVGERPSRYGGMMYCALLSPAGEPGRTR